MSRTNAEPCVGSHIGHKKKKELRGRKKKRTAHGQPGWTMQFTLFIPCSLAFLCLVRGWGGGV